MLQTIIVILIVAACVAWLAVMAWRYLRPKPDGKACAGGCCDAADKRPASESTSSAPRIQMISSDDLRNRLAARKS
jgi:hypothetical protein